MNKIIEHLGRAALLLAGIGGCSSEQGSGGDRSGGVQIAISGEDIATEDGGRSSELSKGMLRAG